MQDLLGFCLEQGTGRNWWDAFWQGLAILSIHGSLPLDREHETFQNAASQPMGIDLTSLLLNLAIIAS